MWIGLSWFMLLLSIIFSDATWWYSAAGRDGLESQVGFAHISDA